MSDLESDKLKQVVFERLTVGESREGLFKELSRKLDRDTAREIIIDAVDTIATQRKNGTYKTVARGIRNRRLYKSYMVWKRFGFILLIGSGIFILFGILIGAPFLALGPLFAGFVILVTVDPKINAQIAAADAAVDRLFVEDFLI